MKKTLMLLVSLLAFSIFAQTPKNMDNNSKKTIRVLAIGNSWCWSLVRYFKLVSENTDEYNLELQFVVVGGWTFQRHWKEYEKYLADPSYKTYQYGLLSKPDEQRYSLVEKLEMQKWDYVVLTQCSQHAERIEDTEPYLKNLLEVIRKHAPTAEILLQQCWSYNINEPHFGKDPEAAYAAQTAMYNNMTATTEKMAEEFQLRVIPTGYAVEMFRDGKPMPLLDEEALQQVRPKSDLPMHPDVVGYYMWYKLGTPQEHWLGDPLHLNFAGEYLQACVWYAALLGGDPEKVDFHPVQVTQEQVQKLRTIAKKAVAKHFQQKIQ